MELRLGAVVLNCNDLARQRAFWTAALSLTPGPVTENGSFQVLAGKDVNLSLQLTEEPALGRGHMHLDLYTSDQAGEVRRLVDLGASVERHNRDEGDDYVVMRDPEGNPFCVCSVER